MIQRHCVRAETPASSALTIRVRIRHNGPRHATTALSKTGHAGPRPGRVVDRGRSAGALFRREWIRFGYRSPAPASPLRPRIDSPVVLRSSAQNSEEAAAFCNNRRRVRKWSRKTSQECDPVTDLGQQSGSPPHRSVHHAISERQSSCALAPAQSHRDVFHRRPGSPAGPVPNGSDSSEAQRCSCRRTTRNTTFPARIHPG